MSQSQGKQSSLNLFSPENMIDPYPLYKQLRDEEPVHYLEEMNLHVVTRYDLLRDCLLYTSPSPRDRG